MYVQLVVNPAGRVDGCEVLLSSGYNDLDYVTCQLVTKRARFSPAQDENGKPIFSTYREVFKWQIRNYGSRAGVASLPEMPPDLDLTINQEPAGVKLPLQFTVHYFVKANGTPDGCGIASYSNPGPQALVDLACKAVMQLPIRVILDRNNKPVDAYEVQSVRFTVDKRAQ